MPQSFPSERSAGFNDEKDLKAGPSAQNSLTDQCNDEESAPDYIPYPDYPPAGYEEHPSGPRSDFKQPSGSRPCSEDSKRSAYPSQQSPTESEQLTALLRETLDRFARAGERYDAFLSARDQISAPSRTASPPQSGSLWSKLAKGPPPRTFDYSLDNLKSFISERRAKLAAAVKGPRISPEEEMATCHWDLCSIIAESRSVPRAQYVKMVEEAITDGRWNSSAKYAWDEERERSCKAD